MWQLYVYSFLAGIVVTLGIPSFIKGLTGDKYKSPLGSTPTLNVVWGWVCFVVAGFLAYDAHPRARHHELRSFGLFALGILLVALFLAATVPTQAKVKK
jgi:sterol desaturase/sphingolipid hydroxylase (fatty acid hydroxylase superfamily)